MLFRIGLLFWENKPIRWLGGRYCRWFQDVSIVFTGTSSPVISVVGPTLKLCKSAKRCVCGWTDMTVCVKERCSSCWSRGCETWLHWCFFFKWLKLNEGFLSCFWLDSNIFSIWLSSWIHASKDKHWQYYLRHSNCVDVRCLSLWGWIGKSEFKRMWRYLQFSRSRRTTRFLLLVRRVKLGWVHHKSS